jgi:hypothetical protein
VAWHQGFRQRVERLTIQASMTANDAWFQATVTKVKSAGMANVEAGDVVEYDASDNGNPGVIADLFMFRGVTDQGNESPPTAKLPSKVIQSTRGTSPSRGRVRRVKTLPRGSPVATLERRESAPSPGHSLVLRVADGPNSTPGLLAQRAAPGLQQVDFPPRVRTPGCADFAQKLLADSGQKCRASAPVLFLVRRIKRHTHGFASLRKIRSSQRGFPAACSRNPVELKPAKRLVTSFATTAPATNRRRRNRPPAPVPRDATRLALDPDVGDSDNRPKHSRRRLKRRLRDEPAHPDLAKTRRSLVLTLWEASGCVPWATISTRPLAQRSTSS